VDMPDLAFDVVVGIDFRNVHGFAHAAGFKGQ